MKPLRVSESPEPRGRRDKRNQILDAALRVFARLGYHGARVSDIAREAGIAYGLVYHYFRNKEEILGTIFEERWTAFLAAVDDIAAAPKGCEEKLLQVASLILGAYRLRPDWVKVLVLEIQRSSRFAEPSQIRAVGRLFQTVARVLREGQAAGEVRRDLDPEIASTVFLGGLELFITSLVLEVTRIDAREPEDEYYARAARTVVGVFFNGARAGDPE